MKKTISVLLVVAMLASLLALSGCGGKKQAESKLCWYFPLPDPYADEVKGYAEQFAEDYDVDLKIMIGSDLEQSTGYQHACSGGRRLQWVFRISFHGRCGGPVFRAEVP